MEKRVNLFVAFKLDNCLRLKTLPQDTPRPKLGKAVAQRHNLVAKLAY